MLSNIYLILIFSGKRRPSDSIGPASKVDDAQNENSNGGGSECDQIGERQSPCAGLRILFAI